MHQVNKLFVIFLQATFFLPQTAAIVGGQKAKVPPFDDPVVFINHIGRFSRVQGF
jgi:hypothetical protein